jgi:DNA replication and repair protein RecF
MFLENIQVVGFRNLNSLSLDLHPEINLIYGDNGSGKTSLIESMHYLGFGRSFRTRKPKSVIKHEEPMFTVHGKLRQEGSSIPVGIQKYRDQRTKIRVDGEDVERLSEMVKLCPMQLYTPQSTELLTGSPSVRRSFLDWGLFHVEHPFLSDYTRFKRALSQRNALLKSAQSGRIEYNFWTKEYVESGKLIDAHRRKHFDVVSDYIRRYLNQFLESFNIDIQLYSGWDSTLSLDESVEASGERDRKIGFTHNGPHKADVRLKNNRVPITEVLSRGQLRLASVALQLAQAHFLKDNAGISCLLLIDDLSAELDSNARSVFMQAVTNLESQLVVSAIDKTDFGEFYQYDNKKVFHVEQGEVNEETY